MLEWQERSGEVEKCNGCDAVAVCLYVQDSVLHVMCSAVAYSLFV